MAKARKTGYVPIIEQRELTLKKIKECVKKNPKATTAEVARLTGLSETSETTVAKYRKQL